MPLRLPPLSSLRLFEAAGRLRSFKLAAAELNVTPSAVSHGIVGLEETLGVELFVRGPRGLSLSAAGVDYLSYVSEAFALLAVGTQRLPALRKSGISVSCAPTFAARWLLPRLAEFRKRRPQVDVTVDTSRRQVGFPADGFDFAIRMSRVPSTDAAWTRLFGEALLPVCTPTYRETLLDAGGKVDLRRATLIHVMPASEDWPAWLDGASVKDVDVAAGLRFDTIELAFAAAASGLGVAIGRRPLIDPELASGVLVAASANSFVAATAYWLVSSAAVENRPDLAAFRDWLVEETARFRAIDE
jgi:DNA-binding transcriptional LysR family regulator